MSNPIGIANMTEKEYRKYPAVNSSLLKSLDAHPSMALSDEDITNDGIIFGDLVDRLCFSPRSVADKYYVSDISMPSDNIKSIMDIVFDEYQVSSTTGASNERRVNDAIYHAAGRINYGQNWKADTIIRKVREAGLNYLNDRINAGDKIVISPDVMDRAKEARTSLISHPWTAPYFNSVSKHIKILFQVPILFRVVSDDKKVNEECKVLIDILVINERDKSVFPVDLKTMWKYTKFFDSEFVSRRYYIQAAYYFEAVSIAFQDYNVKNFRFICLSSQSLYNPIIYMCTNKDLSVGKNGGTIQGRTVKGWMQLLEEYIWHKSNDRWDYPYEVYKNRGTLKLDVFD